MADPLRLQTTLKQGDAGPEVKLVQEWLNLRGFKLNVTSAFGAPTEAAVLDFCASEGLPAQAEVDNVLFGRLIEPMLAAIAPAITSASLADAVLQVGEQQLAQSPREVGGPNAGPWVRLYMNGKEGPQQAWCAGFVSYCLSRACEALKVPMPFGPSVSVDQLVVSAMKRGRQVPASGDVSVVQPGDLFVVASRAPGDWVHTGVVRSIDDTGFESIEGNASLTDPHNGERVLSKRRAFGACDFLKVGT